MEDWSHYSTKISVHQRKADDAANSRDYEEAAFHAKELLFTAAMLVLAIEKEQEKQNEHDEQARHRRESISG